MTALYNEIDPKAAAWLRELIKQGLIAPGDVNENSIEDLTPNDLKPYTQVHFFAGIGVWSYALRAAGWPDDRPVWTGSCPCQPFSQAGKGGGFADERHLWPAFHYLIDQCRPDVVFGEQVASKDGLGWLDLVQADLEGTGYASGAVDLCAAGVGAPHIRQRLWWYGERLDYAASARHTSAWRGQQEQPEGGERLLGVGREDSGLADNAEPGREPRGRDGVQSERAGAPRVELGRLRETGEAGNTNGYWADAEWLPCIGDEWRPVEPGTFPLAHGAPERVGRLRGYGNAIVAPAAQAFIEAYLGASHG